MNFENSYCYGNIILKEMVNIEIYKTDEPKVFYTKMDLADVYNRLHTIYGDKVKINLISDIKIMGDFGEYEDFKIFTQ